MRALHFFLAAALILAILAPAIQAQQVTMGTPFNQVGSSFFEHNGVSFSGNWRGINFNVGGAGLSNPAFGGFDPSAGAHTGFAISGPQGQLNFGLDFAQGSRSSIISQTPMVTIMNGQSGLFMDASQTPFVISAIPVVGAFSPVNAFNMPSPFAVDQASGFAPPPANWRVQAMRQAKAELQNGNAAPAAPAAKARAAANPQQAAAAERLIAAQESTAGRAAPSVAEARRIHAAEKAAADGQLLALMERARAAEEDGKPNVAKVYYQMVARRADGEIKQQAQSRLDAIRNTAAR
jgi:hypothetical protein